jgi:NADH dehydrogenase [ubiquinone] 1 alpha subcomplex assembly factor 7
MQAAAGAPPRVQLIELGPGKGTMMADMLRAMKQLPIFPALSVHMVEGATALPPLEVPRGSAQMPAACAGLIARVTFDRSLTP